MNQIILIYSQRFRINFALRCTASVQISREMKTVVRWPAKAEPIFNECCMNEMRNRPPRIQRAQRIWWTTTWIAHDIIEYGLDFGLNWCLLVSIPGSFLSPTLSLSLSQLLIENFWFSVSVYDGCNCIRSSNQCTEPTNIRLVVVSVCVCRVPKWDITYTTPVNLQIAFAKVYIDTMQCMTYKENR